MFLAYLLPHKHHASQAPAPFDPTATCCSSSRSSRSSGGGDETGECFGQGRRVAGRGADRQNTPSQLETKERPAKGPKAQSCVKLQCTSHTHTYMYTHTVIIYLPSTLLFLSFLLHSNPFPASVVFVWSHLLYPNFCFYFSLLLYASYFACLPVSPASPSCMCMNVQSVWERRGQSRGKPISKFPLLLLVIALGNAPMPSTSSAVYARIM